MLIAQPQNKMKPARKTRSCPLPSIQRRQMSVPRPGVPSRLSSAAFLAVARLSGRPFGENSFIREHHRREADGRGEQRADAARTKTRDIEQADQNGQPENEPPMF